jgi:hypothetical protein
MKLQPNVYAAVGQKLDVEFEIESQQPIKKPKNI